MTDRAQAALAAARVAATGCGHASIDAPHVLLGILADPRTNGAQALRHGGLTYDGVFDVVAQTSERRPDGLDASQPLGHEAGMLLRGALREARTLNEEFVGTAHLALACTRRDGATSVGPIVAGHERMIRDAALGLLERAARLAASQPTRDQLRGSAPMEELLLDPPDFPRNAKVLDVLVSLPRLGHVRVARPL